MNASGEQQILEDVNAEFKAGKMYAIVGESGSGKTTFLSLISALDKLQEGDIKYNSKSLRKIGGSEFRLKYVNIVFQSYNLIKYMIAMALMLEPDLVIADEPTGNLDEETEEKIIGLFKDLAHKEKKIVIIVTHSKQVANHADKILKLRKGKLA